LQGEARGLAWVLNLPVNVLTGMKQEEEKEARKVQENAGT
jgi:hypothetical protein